MQLLQLILPFLIGVNAHFAPVEDVTEMLAKFESLSASTADVLEFVKKLNAETMVFLKLAFPIGSLIAGALQIATKTESEEYIALKKMNETMLKQFRKLDESIGFAIHEIGLGAKMMDYANKVQVPMLELDRQGRLFWNPAINKNRFDVQNFQKVCYLERRDTNPLQILDYIHTHTVTNCPMSLATSKQRTILISQFYSFLRKLRATCSAEPIEGTERDVEANEAEILSRLGYALQNDDTMVWSLLADLEQAFVLSPNAPKFRTMKEALDAVYQFVAVQTQGFEPVPTVESCLLNDIVEGKRFHHRAITQLANVIRQHTLKLLLFGAVCANITFSGDPANMERYQQEIFNSVHAILKNTKDWIPKKLNSSWPRIDEVALKSAIDAFVQIMPVEDNSAILKAIAINISESMKVVGNPKFAHQLLIVPAARQVGIDFQTICPPKYCLNVTDYSTLHVVMTRFNVDHESRLMTAYNWLHGGDGSVGVEGKIKAVLESNYNADRVDKLLSRIEYECRIRLSNRLFRSVALVRKSTVLSYKCLNPAWAFSPYITEQYEGITFVNYFFRGQLVPVPRDCEDFKLYFFA